MHSQRIDIAIWDALGKRNDLPVAALLESQLSRTNIPVYLSGLRRATLDERITQAKSLADQGVRGAKSSNPATSKPPSKNSTPS